MTKFEEDEEKRFRAEYRAVIAAWTAIQSQLDTTTFDQFVTWLDEHCLSEFIEMMPVVDKNGDVVA